MNIPKLLGKKRKYYCIGEAGEDVEGYIEELERIVFVQEEACENMEDSLKKYQVEEGAAESAERWSWWAMAINIKGGQDSAA